MADDVMEVAGPTISSLTGHNVKNGATSPLDSSAVASLQMDVALSEKVDQLTAAFDKLVHARPSRSMLAVFVP